MSVRRGQEYTISFPIIDSDNRPTRKVGVTFLNTDVRVSKDGGSFAVATNTPTEIGSTGRYKLTLTSAEMDAGWVHVYVEKTGSDPYDERIGTSADTSGLVVTSGSNTSSAFKTDLPQTVNDYWKDALLRFVSGSLLGQVKKVTAFDGTSKVITLGSGFTSTPTAGDKFIVVSD